MMNSAAAQIGAKPRFTGLANLRDNPRLLEKLAAVDYARFPGLTWSRLEWLKGLTGLPLVIKEVLTPDDAKRCVDHGADAIVVSNHGARSMDTTQATIEALPAIVEAVGGQIEIYLDSGVRRGTDVFKALALGARAVLVGRPLFWGLAIDGEAGVRRMFESTACRDGRGHGVRRLQRPRRDRPVAGDHAVTASGLGSSAVSPTRRTGQS